MAVTKVQIDPAGNYVIEIPDDMLREVGWKIGDTIIWEETLISHDDYEGEGFVLRKKDET